MAEILSQIDIAGNLDASWFLSIITVVAGFLLWNQVKEIKHDIHEMVTSMKDLVKVVNRNDKRISILEYKAGIEPDDEE